MSEQNQNPAAEQNPGDIFSQRVAKVEELRAQGIDPFGSRYDDVQSIESVRELQVESENEPGASVNFTALPRMLISTCLSFIASPI